jgi:hypothetical protein
MMAFSIDSSLVRVRRMGLRRAVVALLAFSYLLVGFAHTLKHCEASGVTGIYQAVVIAADNSSGDPQQPSCGEHCHTCMAVSVPLAAQTVAPIQAAANIPAPPRRHLVAQPPAADPPPPKSLT